MTEENTPQRILVVEDDINVCQALKSRLTHEGFDVAVAKDAISAVSTARQQQSEVALIDINLPGGSGFEVARRLERMFGKGALRLVFMTASKEPGLRQEALSVGASAFVEKPFTKEALLEAIGKAMGSTPPEIFGE